MAVHLIEQQMGKKLAAICAKALLVDPSATEQTPFQDLLEREISADPLVANAQYYLQKHLSEPTDLNKLARHAHTSPRTLIRHFKAEFDLTPLTYLQNLRPRIRSAKNFLENENAPLSVIIEQVGYRDISSFSRLFKRRTGLTPKAYRQKFGHRARGGE